VIRQGLRLTFARFFSTFSLLFAVPGHEHKSQKKDAHPVSGIDAPGETGVMYVTSRATANGWSAKNNEVRRLFLLCRFSFLPIRGVLILLRTTVGKLRALAAFLPVSFA
jgi:hypothetical protein